jgi:hypothetical protein
VRSHVDLKGKLLNYSRFYATFVQPIHSIQRSDTSRAQPRHQLHQANHGNDFNWSTRTNSHKSNSTHHCSSLPHLPFPVPASHIPTPASVRRLEMSNRPSRPARSARQPFRLLDLPRELFVPIVRSYRSSVPENWAGLVIYEGEEDEERYEVLRDLCLTHRDILPFAQEELYKRLHIGSDEEMDLLNRSIANSGRCKEYAGRAESIYVGYGIDVDKLIESGTFNPRELRCPFTMKFSILSRFCANDLHLSSAEFYIIDRSISKPSSSSSLRGTIRCGTSPPQSRDVLCISAKSDR